MEAEALVRSDSRDRLTSPTISSSANIKTKMEKTNGEMNQEITNGLNNNNSISQKSKTNGSGVLPSFSDILWCTDVDGDVMSSPLDSAMVRRYFHQIMLCLILSC